MSIATLINVPRTPAELAQWSFANEASHRDIIRRVQEARSVRLNEFIVAPLDPTKQGNLAAFLANNQQMHYDMNRVLGLAGNVLNAVDWQDEQALSEWIFEHYVEHQAASRILGIG